MATTEITAPPGIPQITITRAFSAPRDLVFRAHVEPDLLVQWLGPSRMAMTVHCLEARHGGAWRYTHRDATGAEYGFRGVFHGDPSPKGIIQTFEYEGAPGSVSLQTMTFAEHNGGTLLRVNAIYQSVADRDSYVESGMDKGVYDSMDRLDALLSRLATTT